MVHWLAYLESVIPSKEAIVLCVSALPFVEARASVPLALTGFHFSYLKTALLAWVGNAIPLCVVWITIKPLLTFSYRRFPRLHTTLTSKIEKLSTRYGASYLRYGALLLCFFVAIPLPGSGVWTASLLAIALEIPWKYAAPAILIGLCLSILIIELATAGVLKIIV